LESNLHQLGSPPEKLFSRTAALLLKVPFSRRAKAPTFGRDTVWERARNQLRETLREATFDKLLKDESCLGNLMLHENQEKEVRGA
jgi:hypothetical protein